MTITTTHPWRNNDPADHARRAQRQHEMVLRAQLRKVATEEPASVYDLATEGEHLVADELRAAGFVVELTSYNNHVDLLVGDSRQAGQLRIEVKTARWRIQHSRTRKARGRYQAAIRPAQLREADLVILVFRNGADHFFVIPAAELAGRRNVTIRCYNAARYSGRWSKYYNAFWLVGPALEHARACRPAQLPLEVAP